MYRIDHPTAAGVLPAPSAPGIGGFFASAPPGSGSVPTIVTADWCNGIQEELLSCLTFAGIAPDKTKTNQLLQSIQSIAGSSAVVGAGAIFGLELSNTAASPTTSVTISAGLARDSTNTSGLTLAVPMAKSLTALWAAGTGNGGRDIGALANGQTWHVFLILNPTTSAVDALFSQSATAPTLPAGFTKFRRLGAIVLDAAATTIRQFRQDGDWFEYVTRSVDYANQSNGGAPALRPLAVPVGVKVEAYLYFQSTGTVDQTAYLSLLWDPDKGAPPAFGGSSQWAQIRRMSRQTEFSGTVGYISYESVMARVRTDANGKIYTYSSDPADVIAVGVVAWTDTRGKFY